MKKHVLSIGAMCLMTLVTGHAAFAQEQIQTASAVQSPSAATVVVPDKHQMSVKSRLARQQARINQGIMDGELTRGEAKNLEHHEANIATDAKIDRAENGGKLTPQEHKNLEARLNKQSGRIYRLKHNGRER
jgi:hypothetical protein